MGFDLVLIFTLPPNAGAEPCHGKKFAIEISANFSYSKRI